MDPGALREIVQGQVFEGLDPEAIAKILNYGGRLQVAAAAEPAPGKRILERHARILDVVIGIPGAPNAASAEDVREALAGSKEPYFSRLRQELDEDPESRGYSGKSAEEVADLLNSGFFVAVEAGPESPDPGKQIVEILPLSGPAVSAKQVQEAIAMEAPDAHNG